MGAFWGDFPPRPLRGTLTPLVPLSLRANKGEGEKKQRGAPAPRRRCTPLVWYWGEGDRESWLARDGVGWGRDAGDYSRGMGMTLKGLPLSGNPFNLDRRVRAAGR